MKAEAGISDMVIWYARKLSLAGLCPSPGGIPRFAWDIIP